VRRVRLLDRAPQRRHVHGPPVDKHGRRRRRGAPRARAAAARAAAATAAAGGRQPAHVPARLVVEPRVRRHVVPDAPVPAPQRPHGHQARGDLRAEDLADGVQARGAVAAGRRHVSARLALAPQRKGDARPVHRVFPDDVQQQGVLLGGPEARAPGGHVVEEVLDRDGGAGDGRDGLGAGRVEQLAVAVAGAEAVLRGRQGSAPGRAGRRRRPRPAALAFGAAAATARVLLLLLGHPAHRRHGQVRHERHARQRLAPEPQRRDRLEVLERAQLAGRVPPRQQRQVARGDARAVVLHLQQAAAAVARGDGDAARARVEGVLEELLEGGGGALDDLARGDAVDRLEGELADAREGGGGEQEGVDRGRRRALLPLSGVGVGVGVDSAVDLHLSFLFFLCVLVRCCCFSAMMTMRRH